MSQSYHEQFRENRRGKNQNGVLSKSKATANNKLPTQRPTAAAKQPLRSDTFTLPAIRNGANLRSAKANRQKNGFQQEPVKKSAPIKRTPPAQQQRNSEDMRRNAPIRPIMKQNNGFIDSGHLDRRPVRFANNYNTTYSAPPASSLPPHHQKPPPPDDRLPQNDYDRPRRMRVSDDEYIVNRRVESPVYAYDDYHTVSNIPTISYSKVLPPIHHPPPTIVIHPKQTHQFEPRPTVPIVSSAPPPISIFPPSTIPTYSQIPPMILPPTTISNQPPGQTLFFQPSLNPSYISQPLFYPIPFTNPPSSAPPIPSQTIVNQSSATSASAPAATATATSVKTDENNTPNKNITIQLKMTGEDVSIERRPQRVTRIIHDSPYREVDDRYYTTSEPAHVIYEQPRARKTLIRRAPPPPPTEYVYVDESPARVVRRHAPRSEVVYVDDDRSIEYDDEVIYVDENGNEIEYIYEDEPIHHRRHYRRSHNPSSTNIVYE